MLQVAKLEKEQEVKQQLEAQLGEMSQDVVAKQSALQSLEASHAAQAAEVSDLEAKLSEMAAALQQAQGRCVVVAKAADYSRLEGCLVLHC